MMPELDWLHPGDRTETRRGLLLPAQWVGPMTYENLKQARSAGIKLIDAQAQRQVQTFFDELKNGTRNYRTVASLSGQVAQLCLHAISASSVEWWRKIVNSLALGSTSESPRIAAFVANNCVRLRSSPSGSSGRQTPEFVKMSNSDARAVPSVSRSRIGDRAPSPESHGIIAASTDGADALPRRAMLRACAPRPRGRGGPT